MENKQSFIERVFESGLWKIRFVVLFAVLCSSTACIALFILGSYEIGHVIFEEFFHNSGHDLTSMHSNLLIHFIGAIDLYLIGVVLLIFSFGIYELFISKIDIAREDTDITILEIEDLDELKNKIIKVIIMVLIVSFFEKILSLSDKFNTPLHMMYFALSILALSVGVFLIKMKK
ncbi:MAG: hypothetical protein CL847_05055 [Crocinitomicaceae bacterium]|nr:hypothetical protein [Crocinitomicaceae bacterium]|tara:strand:+ start:1226 stop:1750 length:525 start_codon:yes stop_codon:yes gene_type:complete